MDSNSVFLKKRIQLFKTFFPIVIFGISLACITIAASLTGIKKAQASNECYDPDLGYGDYQSITCNIFTNVMYSCGIALNGSYQWIATANSCQTFNSSSDPNATCSNPQDIANALACGSDHHLYKCIDGAWTLGTPVQGCVDVAKEYCIDPIGEINSIYLNTENEIYYYCKLPNGITPYSETQSGPMQPTWVQLGANYSGPAPTYVNGQCGSCSGCYAPNPDPNSTACAVINGVCSKAGYCASQTTVNTQGAFAYCQDGNGPIYPLSGLNITVSATSDSSPYGSMGSQTITTGKDGQAYFASLPSGANYTASINGVQYYPANIPAQYAGHPLYAYTNSKLPTGQPFGSLTASTQNNSIVMDNSCHTSSWTFTHCGGSWGNTCGTYCTPNNGSPSGPWLDSDSTSYHFNVPSYGQGKYDMVWHFSNCGLKKGTSSYSGSGGTCSTISGWACDGNDYTAPLTAAVYMDGYDNAHLLNGSISANQLSGNSTTDIAVSNQCGGNSSHSFSYTLPSGVSSGSHTFYILANGLNSSGQSSGANQYPLYNASTGAYPVTCTH